MSNIKIIVIQYTSDYSDRQYLKYSIDVPEEIWKWVPADWIKEYADDQFDRVVGEIVADNYATRGLLLELATASNSGTTTTECYHANLVMALGSLWD